MINYATFYSIITIRKELTISKLNLLDFFLHPLSKRQKLYEAIRAVIIDNVSYEDAAKKYNYKPKSLYTLMLKAKSRKLNLFPEVKLGPKKRRVSFEIQEKIIIFRKRDGLSTLDIKEKLNDEGVSLSESTVERVLKDAGLKKIKKRSNKERGVTNRGKTIPNRSEKLDFNKLNKFKTDLPIAGIYQFLPYIIESGILDIVKKCNLPESSSIDSVSACLSILLLKLIGNERLSHIENYDQEPGFGIFAGLNILPKSVYMSKYSCGTSEKMLYKFQEELLLKFLNNYPEFYDGNYINLDFHTIPHYGDKANMEKLWSGAKNKTLKGANTVFAQDSKNNMILYTRADILRKEESEEIKKFIKYWKKIKGSIKETLVFDCKFTKYSILEELSEDNILFITLRKRNKKLIEKALSVSKEKWQKITLPIPKRKYKKISVFEEKVILSDCTKPFRQIVIKDHGRAKPTFIITNNEELILSQVIEVYAKRWRIENKFSELVSFFNLNALSSSLMIRIHFDILWTFIADTLYHIFAKDLRRHERHNAKTIFKKFINIPGKLIYDGENFQIMMRKRSHTPILKSVDKLTKPIKVPWLDNKTVEIIWTP